VESHLVTEAVAKHIFEVAARAESHVSIHALNACFRDALKHLGFQLFACFHVVDSEHGRDVEILYGEGHTAWGSHYRRMQFAEDDPTIREAEQNSDPFYWTDMVRRKSLPLRSLRVIDAAKQFQLNDGFVAPMKSADGSLCFILFAGNGVDSNDAYARAGAHLLSYYYGRLGHRIHYASDKRPRNGLLSHRQRECLAWARVGKSSRDIGEILGISATVVDEHIAKACERLKVRTRVQAILEAGRRGVEF